MLYDLSLHMGYLYDSFAFNARHIIRVMPLSIPDRQRLIAGALSVEPLPEERAAFTDFFQHPAASILIRAPHERLDIRMKARVQVDAVTVSADFSPTLDKLPGELGNCWSLGADSPHHFLGSSPRLPEEPAISAYARAMELKNRTVLEIARAMCRRIHRDFTYDPKATTVDTTPAQAFALKRGVCQDFSHVMITALRSLGIPAGYVSGYLRTIPPPGKERLEGADAMHAWVRIWCGGLAGWVEYDPTNDIPAGTDHIVVGYGRDYSDVAPVIGALKSYGRQKTLQAVDVIPVES